MSLTSIWTSASFFIYKTLWSRWSVNHFQAAITYCFCSSTFSVCEWFMNNLEDYRSPTHGGREDDDAQDVHALAGTGDDFVLDVWSWGDFQKDWVAEIRVVVVGHDIDVVGLRLFDFASTLHDGDQVCAVLKKNHREATVGPQMHEQCPKSHCCHVSRNLTCWNVASIRFDGIMFLSKATHKTRQVMNVGK